MQRYSNISRLFHWLIAALIVAQYVLAELAERAKYQDQLLEQLALLANHKSIGITILVLAVLRLAYRACVKAPLLPSQMPSWQKKASHISHALLYGLLFAMPISGWLMSSAKAYSVSWFNTLALPDFVAPKECLADSLHAVHHYLGEALFVIAALHIAAALKHHFIDKDDVLTRMAGLKSWAFFALVVSVTLLAFGRFFGGTSSIDPGVEHIADTAPVFTQSDLPVWAIDYDNSYIRFTGDQAGAPFTGEWKTWSADIQFDAKQLGQSRFNVTIDTSSGFSNDQERDDTIRSSEFFDVAAFAEAKYLAQRFEKEGENYRSVGQLLMKGVSSEAILTFTVTQNQDQLVLTGTAPLDRLLWNIGSGDWLDTSWVGQEVIVEVMVTTLASPAQKND